MLLGVLAVLLPMATPHFYRRSHQGAVQLNNGRQIYLSLRNYAAEMDHEGAFPAYTDPKNRTGLVMNSNDAFEILVPKYLDDKHPFFNERSAWCKTTSKNAANANKIQPGENDWCYVRGLRDRSPARWPLLANAFAPQSTSYVKDRSKPGGVWKGANAIVVWAGGSAEIVETKEANGTFFVGRHDRPMANAFEKDAEWLTGEDVQVLFPKSP